MFSSFQKTALQPGDSVPHRKYTGLWWYHGLKGNAWQYSECKGSGLPTLSVQIFEWWIHWFPQEEVIFTPSLLLLCPFVPPTIFISRYFGAASKLLFVISFRLCRVTKCCCCVTCSFPLQSGSMSYPAVTLQFGGCWGTARGLVSFYLLILSGNVIKCVKGEFPISSASCWS